jgi:hypothetical protein
VGTSFIVLGRTLGGTTWTVDYQTARADLPATLQVGPTSAITGRRRILSPRMTASPSSPLVPAARKSRSRCTSSTGVGQGAKAQAGSLSPPQLAQVKRVSIDVCGQKPGARKTSNAWLWPQAAV